MNKQIIKLTDTAADRIKEIMSKADNKIIGVRVGVKSGGCHEVELPNGICKGQKEE